MTTMKMINQGSQQFSQYGGDTGGMLGGSGGDNAPDPSSADCDHAPTLIVAKATKRCMGTFGGLCKLPLQWCTGVDSPSVQCVQC